LNKKTNICIIFNKEENKGKKREGAKKKGNGKEGKGGRGIRKFKEIHHYYYHYY
jgi:hypothetical protein